MRISKDTLALACLAALALGCRTTAADTARGQWFEIRSPGFHVWTDGDPALARALVEDLQRFHQVLIAKTTAEERTGLPPLRMFLGGGSSSFRAWTQAPDGLAGLFIPSDRGNFAFIDSIERRDATGMSSRHILFHEYTHYIVASSGARVPLWYNEGLAEYMATTEFREDGSYTLGCPPKHKANRILGWLPIRELMDSDDLFSLDAKGSRVDTYMQSWHAVHYFNDDPARQKQLSEYLRLYGQGVPSAEAVQTAFGMTYTALNVAIRRHASLQKKRCVSIKPARPLAVVAPQVRPLSTAEAYFRVGDLMLAMFGPTKDAIELLKQALALAPQDAHALGALARAHVLNARGRIGQSDDGHAVAALAESDLLQAESYLKRARELAPDDAEVLAVVGLLHLTRAELLREHDPSGVEEQLKLARNAYRKAVRRDESLAEAYVGLGLTYLIKDTGTVEPVVVLETAAYLLPLDTLVARALAQVHIQRGDSLQAVPALEYAMRWSHDEKARAAARVLLDKFRMEAAVAAQEEQRAPAEAQGAPAEPAAQEPAQ
jgi:tetratricopeptide (TPR) repeat protein